MDGLPNENFSIAPVDRSLKTRARFYLSSWSGRIILINACIFVLMSFASKSIFMPPESVLLNFGAKEPVLIASGEWWRLITPVFVHIGLIHFLFNSYALRSIGPQIEAILSPKWFLLIYLVAGVIGNISSNTFNLRISAGASGAIFGLIGSGLVIENYLKKQLKRENSEYRPNQTYTSLALLNLALGLVIPGIDNAAHMGGLFGGVILTMAQLRIRSNRLVSRKPLVGYVLIGLLLVSGVAVTGISMDKTLVSHRFSDEADTAFLIFTSAKEREEKIDGARDSYYHYSRALILDPEDKKLRFKRGRLLMLVGEATDAIKDLSPAASDPALATQFMQLAADLKIGGRSADAEIVERLLGKPE